MGQKLPKLEGGDRHFAGKLGLQACAAPTCIISTDCALLRATGAGKLLSQCEELPMFAPPQDKKPDLKLPW